MEEFGEFDEQDWEKIEQRVWRSMPLEQKAKYREPWISKLEYDKERDQIYKIGSYNLIVAGIEDHTATHTERIIQRTISKVFPYVVSFSNESVIGDIKGNSLSEEHILANYMRDAGNLILGLYLLKDYTDRTGSNYLNEYGDPQTIWRGYGFYIKMSANSRDAATHVRQLSDNLKIRISKEDQEYLGYMEEANLGLPAKKFARERRKKAILMERINPSFLEKVAIILTRGKYLGNNISKDKIRSILSSNSIKE